MLVDGLNWVFNAQEEGNNPDKLKPNLVRRGWGRLPSAHVDPPVLSNEQQQRINGIISWAGNHSFKMDCQQVLVEGNVRDYFKYFMTVGAPLKDTGKVVKKMKLLNKSMDGRGKHTRVKPLRIEVRGVESMRTNIDQ